MSSRDLTAVWTVLESQRPASGIEVAGTGATVNAGEILAGIDSDGRRHLLIPLLPGEAAATNTRGRAVHVLRVAQGSSHFLTMVCLSPDLHSVFTQFARELVESVEAAASPARTATEMYERWRALFSDAAHREVVGEEALVGVIGELLVLDALLDLGVLGDLSCWTGPLNQQHDFRTPSYALEAKATLVREGRIVGISSVDQLETPPGARLYLVHHRLDRDPAGFNLSELVERLLTKGCRRHALSSGMESSGFDLDHLEPYIPRRFRVVESRIYDVDGTSFPRITKDSFADGAVPPGTLRISYSIDLTNQPPKPLDEASASALLRAMSEDAVNAMDS